LKTASGWRAKDIHLIIVFVAEHTVRESKSGNRLVILKVEDKTGAIECIKFSPTEEEIVLVTSHSVLALKVHASPRDVRTQIQITDIYTMKSLQDNLCDALHIMLMRDDDFDQQLESIRNMLLAHPGRCSVLLHIANRIIRASAQICVQHSAYLKNELSQNPIVERVWWT